MQVVNFYFLIVQLLQPLSKAIVPVIGPKVVVVASFLVIFLVLEVLKVPYRAVANKTLV